MRAALILAVTTSYMLCNAFVVSPLQRAPRTAPLWRRSASSSARAQRHGAPLISKTSPALEFTTDAVKAVWPAVPLVATTVLAGGMLVGGAAPAMAADLTALGASGAGLIDSTVGPGFAQAFSLIFVSEIGDKTFFIAALLAAKFSRFISFVGSTGALVVMTFISVAIGQIFNAVPAGLSNGLPLDDVVASLAFAYFGYRTLSEAYELEEDAKGGELLDAEEALEDVGEEASKEFWPLVSQTFALVFAAEFGDRSFLSTIALAAAQNPVSVASGAIVAHTIATAGAVAGGAILSKYISEKFIGYIGGSLFIVFALTTAVGLF